MTSMLSLILAFMLTMGGGAAANICPGPAISPVNACNSSGLNLDANVNEKPLLGEISKIRLFEPMLIAQKARIISLFRINFEKSLLVEHYYFRARHFDPIMGRFLQVDPMGYEDSLNLYQAFNMNGVNFIDPFGDAIDSPTRFTQYKYNPNAGFWGLTWEGSSKGMYEHGGEALAFGTFFALDAAAIPADKALDFVDWAAQKTGIAGLLGFDPGEVKEVLGLTAVLLAGQPETAMVSTAARTRLVGFGGKYFGRVKNFLQNILPRSKSLDAVDEVTDATKVGIKTTEKSLLPGEGKVGTYDELVEAGVKGDNLTPHHMPSKAKMKTYDISSGEGVAMNMEHPIPGKGGRHRITRTYGKSADASEVARQSLAKDIMDARNIYMKEGLYNETIKKALEEVIALNKKLFPWLFKK